MSSSESGIGVPEARIRGLDSRAARPRSTGACATAAPPRRSVHSVRACRERLRRAAGRGCRPSPEIAGTPRARWRGPRGSRTRRRHTRSAARAGTRAMPAPADSITQGRPAARSSSSKQRLHGARTRRAGLRHVTRRHRALELEQIHAEARVGEGAHAVDDELRLLGLHLDVFARLLGVARQRIDEQLEHERDVVPGAGLADALRESCCAAQTAGSRVRPVPGEHLHGVAARALDLLDRPVVDLRRQPAARRLRGRSNPRASGSGRAARRACVIPRG